MGDQGDGALRSLTDEDLKRNGRGSAVASRLRSAIRDRHIVPGERLTEASLAEKLGVSRTPVREGIEKLVADGLLSVAPSRGVVVTELSREQVVQLYALREVMEGAAASFAAAHASQGELAALRNLLGLMDKPKAPPAILAGFNSEFHRAIYSAAHNEFLSQAACRLDDFLILLPGTTYSAPNRPKQAQIEHKAMLQAMDKRDSRGAEEIARQHIREAQAIRLRMLFAGG
jgi:DNA-binding GntR family transcriptional regulator